METPSPSGTRAVLVVAHPGHELRVHRWLEEARPQVWVLTDGSGHGDAGRVPSTERVLARAGARPGPLLGCWSDREAYRILLDRDVEAVRAVVLRLAESLQAERAEMVAGDACEGFNPTHDLCRLIIDLAVSVAAAETARPIATYEFPLEAAPGWRDDPRALHWHLDAAQLERKLAAAAGYPELAEEVARALAAHGAGAFAEEWLYPVTPLATLARCDGAKPRYEVFGEQRVAAGHYARVLRHDEHFAPLATGLLAALQLDTAGVRR